MDKNKIDHPKFKVDVLCTVENLKDTNEILKWIESRPNGCEINLEIEHKQFTRENHLYSV